MQIGFKIQVELAWGKKNYILGSPLCFLEKKTQPECLKALAFLQKAGASPMKELEKVSSPEKCRKTLNSWLCSVGSAPNLLPTFDCSYGKP